VAGDPVKSLCKTKNHPILDYEMVFKFNLNEQVNYNYEDLYVITSMDLPYIHQKNWHKQSSKNTIKTQLKLP